ncbi:MAG: hypothetical protein JXL97_07255 [Bacteroidales bacterium]|nr:hypothetical protein [Bacteroidales bacterium]
MSKKNDEIDLKELGLKIFKFLGNHKIIWIIAFVIAILAGIYKYSTTKIRYEAKMIVTSTLFIENSSGVYVVDLQPVSMLLSILQDKVETSNYNYISSFLDLDDASFLKSMDIAIYSDKALFKSDPQNIEITVEVSDKSKLNELQGKILDYCNNNEFIRASFENQDVTIKNSTRIIDEKLNFVDSLNDLIENEVLKNNQVVLFSLGDWASVVDLELSKVKLNALISSNNPVVIVNGFSDYPEIIDERLVKSLIYFVLVFVLAFVFAFVLEIFKFLKNE